MTRRLVLASASPARLGTLRAAGIDPEVLVSAVDEPAVLMSLGVHDPTLVPGVLARAKAEDVAPRVLGDAVVVGCDSILDVDGDALGKPADAAEAVARWHQIRGRSAVLRSGHHVIDTATGRTAGGTSATTVHFADVSDAEIEAYVATGEPLHVAGAFTIDGYAGAFVTRIEGDHHGVIGISLPLLRELMLELDVPWPDLWRDR